MAFKNEKPSSKATPPQITLKGLFSEVKRLKERIKQTTPRAFPIGSQVKYDNNGHEQIVTVEGHGGGNQLKVRGKSANPYWIYVYRVLDSIK